MTMINVWEYLGIEAIYDFSFLLLSSEAYWCMLVRLSELQRVIKKLILEKDPDISDLLKDAKRLAEELLVEANLDVHMIYQYLEGALLEMVILATLLRVDIEKMLKNFFDRLATKNSRIYAE